MLVYQDLLTEDELLSDSFIYREIENGMLWEVEGNFVPKVAINIDAAIRANPKVKKDFLYQGLKADEGETEEDEADSVDDTAAGEVIDVVGAFRLNKLKRGLTQKELVIHMNRFINQLIPKLDEEKQEKFKKYIEGATKYLLGMFSRLQFYWGQSNREDGSLVFSYYRKGAAAGTPTFLYLAYGLKEIKY